MIRSISSNFAQSLTIGLSWKRIVSPTLESARVESAESSKTKAEVTNAVADLALVT